MIKKICLLTNYNLYETKRYFTKKLSEALQRHGVETKIIDASQTALNRETVDQIRSFSPNLTCSFNSFEPISKGKYLWDFLNIPHLSLLVDPSFYATSLTNSSLSWISCVDRADCEAIRSTGFENVFFLPHAVEKELAYDPKQKRPYDVVFLGSCCDYESLRTIWQQRLSQELIQLLEDAIDLIFSQETISLAQALVTAWNRSGLNPQDVDFIALYSYLDYYTRGKDRIELIRSIKNASVHIFGDIDRENPAAILSWNDYFHGQSNVTIHPSLSFPEAINTLKKSKIVLNSMPFFRDGSHERIFYALGCGCLPLSSESKYLREQFQAGKEILFYQAAKREEVNTLIDEMLCNEKNRFDYAASGRARVMQHHTWDQRVQNLLDTFAKKNI